MTKNRIISITPAAGWFEVCEVGKELWIYPLAFWVVRSKIADGFRLPDGQTTDMGRLGITDLVEGSGADANHREKRGKNGVKRLSGAKRGVR